MKITFTEYDGCFNLDMTAENLAEAATLTRFGMNRTGKLNYCETTVDNGGQFQAGIVFAKSKRANNNVPKRK